MALKWKILTRKVPGRLRPVPFRAVPVNTGKYDCRTRGKKRGGEGGR